MARLIDIVILPLVNLLAAFIVSGIIIALIGENPFHALGVMIKGAFYYKGALGYTLYYTTNFILRALLWQSPHVFIQYWRRGAGGYGGLAGLVAFIDALCLRFWSFSWRFTSAILAAYGARYLNIFGQSGSHIVITTIMFNFITFIMVWLLAGLDCAGAMSPETSNLQMGALAKIHVLAGMMGFDVARSL